MAARLKPSFEGRRLVVDNSAFQRGAHPSVRSEWLQALEAGQLYKTPMLQLEVLYSARNANEYAELREELEAFHSLPLTPIAVEAALAAQQELATRHAGFHRLAHTDYLIAAIAWQNDLAVLHYDQDFDRIARHSLLDFASVWIAPSGSLDAQGSDALHGHRRAVALALGQFTGARGREVLDRVLDLLESELHADGLPLPRRPH